jgi:predicted metal-dependent peptidase
MPDARGRGEASTSSGGQGDRTAAAGGRGEGEGGRQQPTRADGPRSARARALASAAMADLRPDPNTLGAPEQEADQTRQWSERLLRGHAGDGAQSMLRTLIADLPRSRTPWEQVLRTQLARSLAQRPGLSWSRPSRSYIANQGRAGPNRRMPWEPGTTASRAVPRLALIVDVSGSIDDRLMQRFGREIDALSRRLESALVLIIGDDRVRSVEHFAPGDSELQHRHFAGGGDTDFTPLLQEAQRHRPDITVVLTDLQGPAHFRPGAPVIWAVPDAAPGTVVPFGRLLALR